MNWTGEKGIRDMTERNNETRLWRRATGLMGLATLVYGAFVAQGLVSHDTAMSGAGAEASLAGAAAAAGRVYGLGREATEAEIAAWDIDVRPDGAGLPEGSGDVFTGEEVFIEKCAVCHGDFAEGVGRWPVLAGGFDTLTSQRPVKTVGSYWPYLSTVWDYVNRAMPFGDAQSLTADEVYAITAYILYSNHIVDDEFELSRENFAEVRLPNEDGFYMDDRLASPIFAKSEVCMENCKDAVEVTMRAAVLDVTPEETEAKAAEAVAAAEAEETEVAAAEPAAPAIDPALVEAGEKVFKKCKACHQIGEGAANKTGPLLTDIVGAPAAAVEGFRYSGAMRDAAADGLVWDEAALQAFLEKPKKFIRKTKMSFGGLRKAEDRDAVIAYLKANGG